MSSVHYLGKIRRREQFSMPASLITVSEFFGFELPAHFTGFVLRRRKMGTEVHITCDGLSLNLSHLENVYPANFKAARQWIMAESERYGWTLVEGGRLTDRSGSLRANR
jgi:hypothetical protein